MSASSIVSTTYSRCSAAPPARSVRLMSTSALSTGPAFDAFFNAASAELPVEDPDLARRRRRLPHQDRPDSRCNRASTTWTSRTRSISIPVLFFNVNLDPTRRYGSETSASLRVSDSVLAARRRGLYPRGVSRGAVRRQRRAAGVPLHRQWRRDLEHLAELSRRSTPRCAPGASASWTTTRPTPSAASRPTRRSISKLSGAYEHFFWSVSVNNLFNALYYDYAIASTFTAGPLQRLSAAGPNLHGEGRRDRF